MQIKLKNFNEFVRVKNTRRFESNHKNDEKIYLTIVRLQHLLYHNCNKRPNNGNT